MKVRDSPVPDKSIPSTPQSLDDDFHGMQRLGQHNSGVAYSFSDEGGMHHYTPNTSMYASPVHNQWQDDQCLDDSRLDVYRPRSNGHDSRYAWPSDLELFRPQPYPNLYTYPRFSSDYNHMSTPDTSIEDVQAPPSEMKGRRTGPTAGEKARSTNSPRKRKIRSTKADTTKVPRLNAPLSILTKDMDAPLRDMAAWVTRSADDRHKEVEKRNGYITRPMNSFMLYRSAFADRTKQWCLQNNHQVVSSVSGESWPMEPSEIRERYNEYARIERDNHQKAHPGYKFSPSKTNNSARKRKGTSCESEEDGPERDTSDHDWVPSGTRKSVGRQVPKRLGREEDYGEHFINNAPYNARFDPPVFQNSDSGRPLPAPEQEIDNQVGRFQHYEELVGNELPRPTHTGELRVRRMPGPAGHPGTPSGLPGANHDDLFNLNNNLHHKYPPQHPSLHLDPSLAAFDGVYATGVFTDQGFEEYNTEAMAQESKHNIDANKTTEDDEIWGSLNAAGDEAFKTWVNESNGPQ